jgi:hypothetical protein
VRRNGVIVILAAAVILLAGALLFMVGRSGNQDPSASVSPSVPPNVPQSQAQAPAAPNPTAAAAPAAAQPRRVSAESGTTPTAAASIPAAFLGEWKATLDDCDSKLGESGMLVEPQRVLFHESEAQVKRVMIHGPRSIAIEGPFQGEGESWNGRLRMDLSASGEALTIDDVTRHRCPS